MAVSDPHMRAAKRYPWEHSVERMGSKHDTRDDGDAGAQGDRAGAAFDRAATNGGGWSGGDAALGADADGAAVACACDRRADCGDGDAETIDLDSIEVAQEPGARAIFVELL